MTPLCGGGNPGQKKRPRVWGSVIDVDICRVFFWPLLLLGQPSRLQDVLVLALQGGRLRPREGQQQSLWHSVPGSKSSALSTGLEGAGVSPQMQVRE